MRIVLAGPELEESLALRYLQGSVRREGHEAAVVAFNGPADTDSVARRILRERPELVGLSLVAQRRYPEYQELIALLRRRGFAGHITAGGHFAGLRAHEILEETPGLDTILHHDGEDRLPALIRILESGGSLPGDLDGVTWRGPGGALQHVPPIRLIDLESIPEPERRRPDRVLGYRRAPVITSRGCSGTCSFCSIHAWHRQVPGARLRLRSEQNVAEEMAGLTRDLGVRIFIFHDDDFIHPDPDRALLRCRAILDDVERRTGPFAFVIKCRPDDVRPELFAYLKDRGLIRCYVGIETHSPSGIRALNRRVTPETNLRALSILRSLEIYSCFNLLLFHPDSTLREVEENLEFLAGHVEFPFDIARTELYAHSALEQRMIRQRRALGDYRGYDYRIADPRAEQLFQLFSELLWERHFGPNSVLHRSQDLGFRLALLKRFHPELAPSDLESRVAHLIRQVNLDSVAYMRRLIEALPLQDKAEDPAGYGLWEGRSGFSKEVHRRLQAQTAQWNALAFELEARAWLGRSGLSGIRGIAKVPGLLGRTAAAAPFLAVLLGSLACSNTVTVCDPVPPPARWSEDIQPRLDAGCTQAGCHAAAAPAAGLDLTSANSYGNLAGVPSTQASGLARVEPFEPDSSYLVHKLQGTQESVGGSGDRMPKGAPPDPDFTSKVREWIDEGATED